MRGKIGLEEHFAVPETVDDPKSLFPDEDWTELKARMIDLHDRRLKLMDQHGMEMMILSLNAPDRKSTRLNSSHIQKSRMPSSA